MPEPFEEIAQGPSMPGVEPWITTYLDQCRPGPSTARPEREVADKGEAAPRPGKPPERPENAWRLDSTGEKSDVLSMTAVLPVSLKEFQKANPKAGDDLSGVPADGEYKLWHASTGEIDGGWRIQRFDREKNQLVMTKTYTAEVRHQESHSLVESMPGMPEDFRKKIEKKLAELPPNVVAALEKAGYKIITSPYVPDALPGLARLTPRGRPADQTFFNMDGTHDNVSRRIIAPMRELDERGQVNAVMRDEVVVHQIGHALDYANNFLSSDPKFVDAYNAEIAKLPKNDPTVKYLSQPNGAGRQEVFATLFGMALTGPENDWQKPFFQESFPLTLAVVRRQIKGL